MNSLKTKKILYFMPIVLWLVLVFYLSSQNGEETAELSGGIAEWLKKYFFSGVKLETLNHILRRSAHFVLYFICGILLYFGIRVTVKKAPHLVNVAIGTFFAVLDEVHKIPISGRHCDLLEIGLNIAGVIAGTMVFWLAELIAADVRKKRGL